MPFRLLRLQRRTFATKTDVSDVKLEMTSDERKFQ
jgi:hypothetical protein